MTEYQNDMPYTVVGHSSINAPLLNIVLTAAGIKELAKRMNDEDMVSITEWSDYTNECQEIKHYGKIEIIRKKQTRKRGE